MPAILPARLKQQAVLLAENFQQPQAYVRGLQHLLEYYADRAHRPGRSGAPPPILPAYNVRPPVLRQILLELAPLSAADPHSALALADVFWVQPFLEFRLLAAGVLGQIPASQADLVIQRIRLWVRKDPERRLIRALLEPGLSTVRNELPERLIELCREWLDLPDLASRQLGLRALIPLVQEGKFENLPAIFKLVTPFVRQAPPGLRPDVLDMLETLARRSPQETAYFLRQNLEAPESPDTAWFIRQSFNFFPKEIEQSLRASVRRR